MDRTHTHTHNLHAHTHTQYAHTVEGNADLTDVTLRPPEPERVHEVRPRGCQEAEDLNKVEPTGRRPTSDFHNVHAIRWKKKRSKNGRAKFQEYKNPPPLLC